MVLRFEISVNTDILVFRFYVYIKNIGEILLDILIKNSINTDISVLRFYKYIINIEGYFDKNIDKTKIVQNSWKYLEKLQEKINKNIHIKVIF